jgi:hypothetical protein
LIIDDWLLKGEKRGTDETEKRGKGEEEKWGRGELGNYRAVSINKLRDVHW